VHDPPLVLEAPPDVEPSLPAVVGAPVSAVVGAVVASVAGAPVSAAVVPSVTGARVVDPSVSTPLGSGVHPTTKASEVSQHAGM
jgi:hypothetical protein